MRPFTLVFHLSYTSLFTWSQGCSDHCHFLKSPLLTSNVHCNSTDFKITGLFMPNNNIEF